MHPHAQAAIRAAKNQHQWGGYVTVQYLIKRGVPTRLFQLACQLEFDNWLTNFYGK